MFGKFGKSTLGLALISATLAATPALANHNDGYPPQYYNNGYGYDNGYRNSGYDRGYDDRGYRDNGYNSGYRCKKSGTTGLIIGAVAGGLLGRGVVSRGGDRTAGAIIGAGVGALAGRAIDRNGSNRC